MESDDSGHALVDVAYLALISFDGGDGIAVVLRSSDYHINSAATIVVALLVLPFPALFSRLIFSERVLGLRGFIVSRRVVADKVFYARYFGEFSRQQLCGQPRTENLAVYSRVAAGLVKVTEGVFVVIRISGPCFTHHLALLWSGADDIVMRSLGCFSRFLEQQIDLGCGASSVVNLRFHRSDFCSRFPEMIAKIADLGFLARQFPILSVFAASVLRGRSPGFLSVGAGVVSSGFCPDVFPCALPDRYRGVYRVFFRGFGLSCIEGRPWFSLLVLRLTAVTFAAGVLPTMSSTASLSRVYWLLRSSADMSDRALVAES
ncbi:hypothetical protein F2Q68_00016126 [Brassica cretica]|uniref:Uncharacterized protein n=1 Tax=Brassica cretica TaxID=69181 RepID=A0A8S9HNY6_BRACR|nr:hypothetical protein F2Q68_00016126 [Brassica cretica]